MENRSFPYHIRDLIARNDLRAALQQLRDLLDNSPLLDDAIVQSARFHDIRMQIRRGIVSNEDANVEQNKIRLGLLELLREIEEQEAQSPEIQTEISRNISISNSKNAITGSTISAGGNIIIGDGNFIKP